MENYSSINTGQEYYWNVQQNVEYYSVPPVPNFPPSNYNQSSNYNSLYSYNVPPPDVSNVKPTNSVYYSETPVYHGEIANVQNNVSCQNQIDSQNSYQYYGRTDLAQQSVNTDLTQQSVSMDLTQQSVNKKYNNWNSIVEYYNNASNEWQSNSSFTNWETYQNAPVSRYETNKTYDNNKLCLTKSYESLQGTKGSESRYSKEFCHTNSRKRSRSPESRLEKRSRSRYKDHRYDSNEDRRHCKYRERSHSKEYSYDSRDSERRSYKKHRSYKYYSEKSYASNKNRKRSRSQESRSIRDITPINNAKQKGPTERELLLEKYR